jgi:hypothetical protein
MITDVFPTSLLALAASGTLASPAWAGAEPQVVRQTLGPDSLYTSQGCLAPCACLVYEPPFSGALTGGFTLRLTHTDEWTAFYDVTDIDLSTSTEHEPALHYTGAGTFEIGGDFALTERLVLTLVADGEGAETQTFDSGYAVMSGTDPAFPVISLRLQTDTIDCSKRWMQISTVPVPACAADLGGQGGAPGADGVLDNNDFVVFIDAFFNADVVADMGRQGGEPGSDGLFDNNDFVVFIDRFFAGC